MIESKLEQIIRELERALEAGREAKANGEVCVLVKLHEGGIRNASVTVQRTVSIQRQVT